MQDQQSTLARSRLEKKNVLSQIRKVLLWMMNLWGREGEGRVWTRGMEREYSTLVIWCVCPWSTWIAVVKGSLKRVKDGAQRCERHAETKPIRMAFSSLAGTGRNRRRRRMKKATIDTEEFDVHRGNWQVPAATQSDLNTTTTTEGYYRVRLRLLLVRLSLPKATNKQALTYLHK